jgi:hypothetical protein
LPHLCSEQAFLGPSARRTSPVPAQTDILGHLAPALSAWSVWLLIGQLQHSWFRRGWGAPAPQPRCQTARTGVAVKQRRHRGRIGPTRVLRMRSRRCFTATTGRATSEWSIDPPWDPPSAMARDRLVADASAVASRPRDADVTPQRFRPRDRKLAKREPGAGAVRPPDRRQRQLLVERSCNERSNRHQVGPERRRWC